MRRQGRAQPPLTIIGPSTRPPEPPRPLGVAGQALWNRVQGEFRVEDVGSVELLAQACAAADRVEELAAKIRIDGVTIETQMGTKEHPNVKSELAGRAFICRVLQRLGITSEPLHKPRGWRGSRGYE
jgi:hypothetical protein